jgi:hypothetical protein
MSNAEPPSGGMSLLSFSVLESDSLLAEPILDAIDALKGDVTLRYAPQLLPRTLVAVHLRLRRLKTLICSM